MIPERSKAKPQLTLEVQVEARAMRVSGVELGLLTLPHTSGGSPTSVKEWQMAYQGHF